MSLSLLLSRAGGTKGSRTAEVMNVVATACWVFVACLGAWAEKWRIAVFVKWVVR